LRERCFLAAATAMTVAFTAWFLLADPTQWGRHLWPALFVSTGTALYCLAEIWRQILGGKPALRYLALALYAVLIYASATQALQYIESNRWLASYSRPCRGLDVLSPPCRQDEAMALIAEVMDPDVHQPRGDLCRTSPGVFDGRCLKEHLIARIEAAVRQPWRREADVVAVGYAIIFLQHRIYPDEAEFEADYRPILCAPVPAALERYFEESGLARHCGSSSPRKSPAPS
jgi:hypothetical protein